MTGEAAALRLGASPPELNFKMNEHDVICKNLTILGDGSVSALNLYDKWSLKGGREIFLYSLGEKDLDINFSYPSHTGVFRENNLSVCAKAHKSGYYHGILFIESEEQEAGLGIWIKLDVNSKISKEGDLNFFSFLGLFEAFFLASLLAIMIYMRF